MTDEVRPLPPELTDILFRLGGRKLVLVEGPTDAEIFDTWYFEFLADVLFFPVSGNRAVHNHVETLTTARPDVEAYGIRDRDFSDRTDVEKALAGPNERIFLLTRYAIENYLLEPQALFQEVKTFLGRKCPVKSKTDVEHQLLALCQELATVMAANWVLVDKAAACIPAGFDMRRRDDVVRWLVREIACTESEADQLIIDRLAHVDSQLQSMASAHEYTNGKHLMHQVYNWVASAQRGLLKDHLRRLLCVRIKESAGVPDDIRFIVENRILNRA